jgi:lipoyl(octanoyl) transferase
VRAFVSRLEAWVIATLAEFNLTGLTSARAASASGCRAPTSRPLPDGTPREDKIAAIGIRMRKWVSFHGISINVDRT